MTIEHNNLNKRGEGRAFTILAMFILVCKRWRRGENALADCLSRKAKDPFDGRHFIAATKLLDTNWQHGQNETKSNLLDLERLLQAFLFDSILDQNNFDENN